MNSAAGWAAARIFSSTAFNTGSIHPADLQMFSPTAKPVLPPATSLHIDDANDAQIDR